MYSTKNWPLLSIADINECENNNGRCEQICVNSEGAYECVCNVGYRLSQDGRRCIKGMVITHDKGGK